MKEEERDSAMSYLRGLAGGMGEGSDRWLCEVTVGQSVVDSIANFAAAEEADLIAMYTQDRKGLARLIKGSIAAKVGAETDIDTRVLKSDELAAA